jgi:DNA polymerase-3 subunit gamma/tau
VVEFRPEPSLPGDAAGRLREALGRITARTWTVVLGQAEGGPTLAEQQARHSRARIAALSRDPAVRRVLEAFPGAEVLEVRPAAPAGFGAAPDPSHEPTRTSEVERA